MRKFVSLTSDFGIQTQGVGIMEGTVLSIAPDANVVHLMHGLPEFNITAAARTMETTIYLPVGSHVCVCDPGVGTDRKAIICQTERGDYLVGPDNGVLLPASRALGGLTKVHQICNPNYMRQPVSPLFHGRDVFAPAAAHLANGVPIEDFGPQLKGSELVEAPYSEATEAGGVISAKVIQINRFGSLHLNILHAQWDSLGITLGDTLVLCMPGDRKLRLPASRTFGDVPAGECMIMKDDYGRVEVAKNLGSFVEDYPIGVGDKVTLELVQ